mgnify:CR=1 FL=1
MEMEFSIHHDGRNWVASCGEFTVAAASLDELDRMVESELDKRGRLAREGETRVRMCFDTRTIPEWIRQYAQHYFNRVVVFGG